MSTLKVSSIQNASSSSGGVSIDTSGHVTVDGVAMPSSGPLSNRNLIINGAMQVAQRGTSSTGQTSAGYYSVDRFTLGPSTAGTWSISQSTDAPDNFAYSLKLDCTTANTSLSANSMLYYAQKIEGNNLQHLGFGTSNAKPLTFSFWVKSNKTGTYTSELYNEDSSRQISKTFTIDTANTWEHKVINFPADTTGSFDADANTSLWVFVHLGSGSDRNSGTLNDDAWAAVTNADRISSSNVNLADSTSNEIFMTGWQLEVGSVATPFEHRSFEHELNMCRRYYQTKFPYGEAIAANSNYIASSTVGTVGGGPRGHVGYFQPMRATPTITFWNNHLDIAGSANSLVYNNGSWASTTASTSINACGFQYIPAAGSGGLIYYFNWEAAAEL